MSCVTLFTIGSFLCGMAPTLGTLMLFRVLQGAGGGGLAAERASHPGRHVSARRSWSMAFAMYGMAVVHGAGDRADPGRLDRRTIQLAVDFFHQYSGGHFVAVADPAAGRRSALPQAEMAQARGERMDFPGPRADRTWARCVADRARSSGREDDSFRSRSISGWRWSPRSGWRCSIWRELRHRNPVVDLRLFGRRNVGVTQFVMFMVGVSLYSSTVLIPQFLQEIMGYSARQAGMAVSTAESR